MQNDKEQDILQAVHDKYRKLTQLLIGRQLQIAAMESCTSGLVASLITDTEGASAIMRGSLVTYSNEAKLRFGVPAETIERYGVYSRETAEAMADAVRAFYGADIGIGITGSLGRPDPENADSVPGEVHFCIHIGNMPEASCSITLDHAESRFAGKLFAAEAVCDRLMQLI